MVLFEEDEEISMYELKYNVNSLVVEILKREASYEPITDTYKIYIYKLRISINVKKVSIFVENEFDLAHTHYMFSSFLRTKSKEIANSPDDYFKFISYNVY